MLLSSNSDMGSRSGRCWPMARVELEAGAPPPTRIVPPYIREVRPAAFRMSGQATAALDGGAHYLNLIAPTFTIPRLRSVEPLSHTEERP